MSIVALDVQPFGINLLVDTRSAPMQIVKTTKKVEGLRAEK